MTKPPQPEAPESGNQPFMAGAIHAKAPASPNQPCKSALFQALLLVTQPPQPDVAQPSAAQPGVVQPDVAQHGVVQPDVAQGKGVWRQGSGNSQMSAETTLGDGSQQLQKQPPQVTGGGRSVALSFMHVLIYSSFHSLTHPLRHSGIHHDNALFLGLLTPAVVSSAAMLYSVV